MSSNLSRCVPNSPDIWLPTYSRGSGNICGDGQSFSVRILPVRQLSNERTTSRSHLAWNAHIQVWKRDHTQHLPRAQHYDCSQHLHGDGGRERGRKEGGREEGDWVYTNVCSTSDQTLHGGKKTNRTTYLANSDACWRWKSAKTFMSINNKSREYSTSTLLENISTNLIGLWDTRWQTRLHQDFPSVISRNVNCYYIPDSLYVS